MSARHLGPSSIATSTDQKVYSLGTMRPILPFSALQVGRELWLLIHVNLVAVQVLERHSGPVRLYFGLALESHAGVLHAPILPHAVVGHDPKEWLRTTLLADEGPFLVRLGQGQGNRYDFVVRQAERH